MSIYDNEIRTDLDSNEWSSFWCQFQSLMWQFLDMLTTSKKSDTLKQAISFCNVLDTIMWQHVITCSNWSFSASYPYLLLFDYNQLHVLPQPVSE